VPGIEQTINNLAFTQNYEPGSVFKIVTFSAALQAGLITPSSVITVPSSVVVGGRYFHDAEQHPLEHLTATQVLALSFQHRHLRDRHASRRKRSLAQVERLGFGQPTSVDFPGQSPVCW